VALIRLDRSPPRRVLRTFGISLAATGWLIGALLAFGRDAETAGALIAGVATLLGLVPLVAPGTRAARAVYIGVSVPGLAVGNVVGVVLVGIVFYTVVTPIGLIRRVTSKHPFGRPGQESYWTDAKPPRDRDSYELQF